MSHNQRLALIVMLLSAVVLAGVLWATNSRPKRFNWRTTYRVESKEPYGTFVLHKLLENYPGDRPLVDLRDSLAKELPLNTTQANYIFVGEGIYLTPSDLDHLIRFVSAGNTAMLSLDVPPTALLLRLSDYPCQFNEQNLELSVHWDSVSRVNFKHPDLRFDQALPMVFHAKGKTAPHGWSYFDSDYFCRDEQKLIPLGIMQGKGINLVRVDFGQGYLYLHTQPILLTNYFVLKPQGRQYAEALLSHLMPGPIYWDEYNRISNRMANQMNSPGNNRPHLQSDSPLSYVLSQPPLAWAWYLLLSVGLLFLLFGAKRRQAVIPIVEPHTNTSLEFINTIGWLYFHRSSHFQLAGQAMKLFRGYVRERYGIALHDDAAQYSRQVAAKAGVDESLVKDILQLHATFEQHKRTDELQLTVFNRRLEDFYRQSK